MKLILLTCLGWFALFTSKVYAHEVRPAYLQITEIAPETYDVLWKIPARNQSERLSIRVQFPHDIEQLTEPRGSFVGGAYAERWRVRSSGGLSNRTVGIDGLVATGTDVLVRIENANGSTQTAHVFPSHPVFVVESQPKPWQVAGIYLILGVEHIWTGVDHLLFVLGLLLLVNGWRRVVATVTAFTVAHSITLAAATLGFVNVPSQPVEAAIALSIVFVAAEIVYIREGRAGLTARWPWLVAFSFGLLHGLGFASALREVGLPQHSLPIALLFFNFGVELGQLAFIVAMVGLFACGKKIVRTFRIPAPAWSWRLAPYAIGSVAAFWVIQRFAAF